MAWNIVGEIESALLSDMRAVELSTFKIANMNRPVTEGLDQVFIDMVASDGTPGLSLANQFSPTSVESMQVKRVFDPDSPAADADGYVQYMDVDLAQEMIEITMHKRSYELGVKLFNSARSMTQSALQIGRR